MRVNLGVILFVLSVSNGQMVPAAGCTLKSAPPDGDICGVTGHDPVFYYASLPTYVQRLSSLSECRDFCLRLPSDFHGCTNFWWDSTTSRCHYNTKQLLNVTADPTSTVVYYNRTCFHCPSECPQTEGQNLLNNGGFELSPHLAAPWLPKAGDSHAKIVKGGAYGNSSRSFHCKKCILEGAFTVCPDTIYELSFDYRLGSMSPDSNTLEFQLGGSSTYIFRSKRGYRTWHTFKQLLTPDPSTLPFSFSIPSVNTTAEYDNIQITPTNYKYKTVQGAPEVLVNGGFEDGSLAPWSLGDVYKGNVTIVSPGIESTYRLQFTYNEEGYRPELGLKQDFSQTGMALVSGQPYMLSFDYAFNVTKTGFAVSYRIAARTNKHNGDSYSLVNYFNGPDGKVQVAFTPQENSTIFTLGISLDPLRSQSGAAFLIDNISIKELAPPEA